MSTQTSAIFDPDQNPASSQVLNLAERHGWIEQGSVLSEACWWGFHLLPYITSFSYRQSVDQYQSTRVKYLSSNRILVPFFIIWFVKTLDYGPTGVSRKPSTTNSLLLDSNIFPQDGDAYPTLLKKIIKKPKQKYCCWVGKLQSADVCIYYPAFWELVCIENNAKTVIITDEPSCTTHSINYTDYFNMCEQFWLRQSPNMCYMCEGHSLENICVNSLCGTH